MRAKLLDQLDRSPPANVPARDLALSTYLSHHHGRVRYHLSGSECETTSLEGLLALADAEDAHRWQTLRLGYTDPIGAPWLRQAAANDYERVTDSDLVCFAGAQEALYAALHVLLGAGDHAIVVLPSYQSMETIALSLCSVTGVALDPAQAWSLDIDAVAAAIRPNTAAIVISFPNNPTGKLLPAPDFAALVDLCRHHGIWLVSDEVYRLTEHDERRRVPHAADAYERGVSLGVLSKAYGLPGLRIGWLACRDTWFTSRVAAIRQYLSTCSAGPSEVLACIALKAARHLLARNRAIAESNLAHLDQFLASHNSLFDCHPPEGGVVCYPRYKGPEGVEAFVRRIADAGILLAPASVFRSELLSLPTDRFRIGFGKLDFPTGLAALKAALS